MPSSLTAARELLHRCFAAALAAVEPAAAVRAHVVRDGDWLEVDGTRIDLGTVARILVVGAGKASAPMAAAVVDLLGVERIAGGVVVVKDGHAQPVPGIEVREAAHPVPDARGEAGARAIRELLATAGADDLVIACWSGGASALLPAPAHGLSLGDEIATNRALLASGLDIAAMNAVRKHCSQVKGGQLAAVAAPARMLALLVSDVPGDDPAVIGSGPMAADDSDFAAACAACDRAELWDELPPAVVEHLRRGRAGERPETPDSGADCFDRVHHVVVASNAQAVAAAAATARAAGVAVEVRAQWLQGEAAERGRELAAVAADCVIAGGETTVRLGSAPGTGGRNQELALAAARELAGSAAPVVVLAGGSDGTDGPTDAAGGLVDPGTWARIAAAGIDPAQALAGHDAYPALAAAGDLVATGPTLTNVMDLALRLDARALR